MLLPSPGISLSQVHGLSALYNSLISFWKFDEASGNALDSKGATTLTDVNTVTSAAGLVYPTARLFTAASTEYFTAADAPAISTGNITFWIAGWVMVTID